MARAAITPHAKAAWTAPPWHRNSYVATLHRHPHVHAHANASALGHVRVRPGTQHRGRRTYVNSKVYTRSTTSLTQG